MFGKDNGIEFRIKCSDQNVFEGSTKKNMPNISPWILWR